MEEQVYRPYVAPAGHGPSDSSHPSPANSSRSGSPYSHASTSMDASAYEPHDEAEFSPPAQHAHLLPKAKATGKGASGSSRTTSSKVPTKSKGQGSFKCDDCDKVYSRLEYLKRHQRKHADLKPFACDECVKSFARR